MSTQDHSSSPDLVQGRLGASVPPARLAELASAVEGDREDHEHEAAREYGWEWPEILRIGFVAIAAAAVWWRVWEPFPAVSVIGVLGLLVGGWPIFKEALENLFARRMTMELSMSIAIIA